MTRRAAFHRPARLSLHYGKTLGSYTLLLFLSQRGESWLNLLLLFLSKCCHTVLLQKSANWIPGVVIEGAKLIVFKTLSIFSIYVG